MLSTIKFKKKLQTGFFAMVDENFAKIVKIRVFHDLLWRNQYGELMNLFFEKMTTATSHHREGLDNGAFSASDTSWMIVILAVIAFGSVFVSVDCCLMLL